MIIWHTMSLKYERWAELFAEGQWWWDVRRWKIGPAEHDYYMETQARRHHLEGR